MRIIKYSIFQRTDENGNDITFPKRIECKNEAEYDANLPIAQAEAYNGEYTVEDDGEPEPDEIPSQLDRVEAQATYTAMMTDTLLEV